MTIVGGQWVGSGWAVGGQWERGGGNGVGIDWISSLQRVGGG